MSESNRVSMRYQAEGSYGVAGGGNGVAMRYTGETLEVEQPTVKSAEIEASRETTSIQRVGLRVKGSISVEMPYGAHDDLLEWMLFASSWTAGVTVTDTTISAAAADNSLNDSNNGLAGFTAGRWAVARGFTGANIANNGLPFRIVSVAAGKLVVAGITLVNDAAGESVVIEQGEFITNGTTATSFSIEKQFNDLSNEFHVALGCMIAGGAINMTAGEILTGSFEIMGKSMEAETATIMGTPTAAPTGDVMNAVENFIGVYVGGYAAANKLKTRDIKMTIANNLRERVNLGDLGPDSIGAGEFDVTGTFQSYFSASSAYFNTFTANSYTSLAICVKDASGNIYVFELPSVKWSKVAATAQAKNGDTMNDCAFMTRKDPTAGYTFRIYRIAV